MSNHTKIGCIFNVDPDFVDYDLSIDKKTIQDILKGKNIESVIYYRNFNSVEGIQDGTRKTLILGLMTKNYDSDLDIKIEGNNEKSPRVTFLFSEKLLNILKEESEPAIGEPNYTTLKKDKVRFYVNDGFGKDSVVEALNSYEKGFL